MSAPKILALVLAVLVVAVSCDRPIKPDNLPADAMRVVGTVHFYTFEGGFWAVRGDDGVTYDPANGLPAAFQRENLRVSMVVRILKDVVGIHQAGPIVEIIQIDMI